MKMDDFIKQQINQYLCREGYSENQADNVSDMALGFYRKNTITSFPDLTKEALRIAKLQYGVPVKVRP